MARMSGGQFDRRLQRALERRRQSPRRRGAATGDDTASGIVGDGGAAGNVGGSAGGSAGGEAGVAGGAKGRLSSARRVEIAELAEYVAETHAQGGHSKHIQRVDPAAIAAAKGLTLSFNDYGEGFDGLLECVDGRFHIYVNTTGTPGPQSPRCRFTLAHELGHWFLDAHRNALLAGRAAAHRSLAGWESTNLAEQEADAFAAALLMPAEPFARAAAGLPRGMAALVELARRFGASLTAAALRCAELDLWPCAVVKFDLAGLAWKRFSSAGLVGRCRRVVEVPRRLAAGSPTSRLLAGERPKPSRSTDAAQPETAANTPAPWLEAATVASAWLSAVDDDDERNALLLEQAASLGRHGVLTVLTPLDNGPWR